MGDRCKRYRRERAFPQHPTCLNLRDGLLRACAALLPHESPSSHVRMPNHLLHRHGIGLVEEGKGGGGVVQIMHDDARILHDG